jgi:hypothetical protein
MSFWKKVGEMVPSRHRATSRYCCRGGGCQHRAPLACHRRGGGRRHQAPARRLDNHLAFSAFTHFTPPAPATVTKGRHPTAHSVRMASWRRGRRRGAYRSAKASTNFQLKIESRESEADFQLKIQSRESKVWGE